MNWFLLALKNTLDYKGRSRRKELGWFLLINAIISILFDILISFSAALKLVTFANVLENISMIIVYLLYLPYMSLLIRRLHDLGYSGYWSLIHWLPMMLFWGYFFWVLGEYNEAILAQQMENSPRLVLMGLVWIVSLVVFTLYLIFKDGQKQANRYGESPKYTLQAVEQHSGDLSV